jgi:hypothetical protein
VYVSRLRGALPAPPDPVPGVSVIRRSDGYALVGDPDTCDLNRFQRLTAKGYAAWPDDPDRARSALHQALSLWRGEPLHEFVHEPFAQAEAVRLSALHASAFDLRVEADLACGRHRQVVCELEELTPRFPLNERLHAQLMVALYRCQRQADALAVYRRLRRSLVQELAVEPMELLRVLERAILNRSPDLDRLGPSGWASTPVPVARRPDPATRDDPVPAQNLPPRLRCFAGRESHLAELDAEPGPAGTQPHIHVLHGMGGVGKSQIALEYAHRADRRWRYRWWINADDAGLIPQQLAEFGRAIGLRVPPTAQAGMVMLGWLSRRNDWLLVFDNAAGPSTVAPFLPSGAGMVVITSRRRGWSEIGSSTQVDVLPRAETVALLHRRIPALDEDVAECIAEEIGDLPLAAAQVASYLEQTDTDPRRYLHMFRTRRAALLGRGEVIGYDARVDTTWALSLDRLRADSPSGVALLETASLLAPDDIPLALFRTADDAAEDALAAAVTYSLARRRPGGFQVHRLVQVVIRHRLDPGRRQQLSDAVIAMLIDARPGPPDRPDQWRAYRSIVPYVLAAQELLERRSAGRRLLLDTVRYLLATGDLHATRATAAGLLEHWTSMLGPDHVDVLQLAADVLFLTTWCGWNGAAAELGADLCRRTGRVLGDTHPTALACAAHYVLALAWDGQAQAAVILGRQTADLAGRVLGPNHPATLLALANTTTALGWTGDHAQASVVGRLAYERSRARFGPDHALTLHAAAMLSYAELWLGSIEHAYELARDAYERASRTHPPDHPTTLWLGATLGFALIRTGRFTEAHDLTHRTHKRAAAALGADHTITLVAGSVDGLAALRVGDLEHVQTVGRATWVGLVRGHGADHPIALGVATTLCLGLAAMQDARLWSVTFAFDTAERSERVYGADHPNTTNARAAAEAFAGLARSSRRFETR